jgi:hypothetical protein
MATKQQPFINLLFYSQKCKDSQDLINLLDHEKLLNKFKMICVDNNRQIPAQIQRTPTLIVNGIPKPLVANEAFKWVETMKSFRQIQQQTLAHQNQQILKQNMQRLTQQRKGPSEFDQKGMNSGLSDTFADVEKDTCLPHTYVPVGSTGQLIFTAPEEKKPEDKSVEQKKRIEEMNKHADERKKDRDEQDRSVKKQQETFQQQVVTLAKKGVQVPNFFGKTN